MISSVSLNLNTVNLKRNMTARTGDGVEYTDGVMHIAKLRIDLRVVDATTGGQGESLINGGVIYLGLNGPAVRQGGGWTKAPTTISRNPSALDWRL